jgi:MFS family permease
VVNAYVLTFGGALLLGGRLADRLGRRRIFTVGLGVFSLASLAGGLAQSEAWLIGARAIQGLGAALLAPAALSLVTATFREGAERNKALDLPGAASVTAGLSALVFALVRATTVGWGSSQTIGVLAGAVLLLIAFGAIERRSAAPLVPFAFLRLGSSAPPTRRCSAAERPLSVCSTSFRYTSRRFSATAP